jgi:uncharacterized protein (TIGR03083 family)
MDMTARPNDAAVEELLGAYALDACDADEAAAVEALLARRPDLAREATELANAAAWVGATEALEAPAGLRDSLFARARARRGDEMLDASLRVYQASTTRLEETFDALVDDDHSEVTANGLTAHDLVVHLAAQESLLAQAVGAETVPEIRDTDVPARTAALIERLGDRPVGEAREVWRRSVDAVQAWAANPSSRAASLRWLTFEMPRDNILVARAFENWIHRDDLRAAMGLVADPPPAAELHAMADLSLGAMPMALEATGHARRGKVARFVLTGPGGGEWTVAMGAGEVAPTGAADVTVTADIVDWCRLAGERLRADALHVDVAGDESLVADLVAAAPAFATL